MARAGLVVITGASRRIGRAIAEKCASCAHAVIVTSRSAEGAAELVKYLQDQYKVQADIIVGDIGEESEAQRVGKLLCEHKFTKEHGGIAGLVHNASVFEEADFEDQEAYHALKLNMSLHVSAPFLLTQALLEPLKSAGGSVVGLTDTSHGRCWRNLEHYTVTKAALRQLMINLAGTLGKYGVRANCVSPGYILKAESVEEDYDALLNRIPLGRMGTPEDIANAVHFLLTSPYITGQVLAVDGGLSINT